MLHRVLCLVAGYVFGLFQTGYFVGKHMNVDIRTKGSGNSGTTNALRVLGPKAGAVVFAGDVGKSVVLCLIVRAIYSKIMPDAALLMMLYKCSVLTKRLPLKVHRKSLTRLLLS